MGWLNLGRDAVSICASVALLSGCGGERTAAIPGAAAGGAVFPPGERQALGRSWMRASVSGGDLLYVSNFYSGYVYVYSYPQGELVGTLTGFVGPAGECSDSDGDVFITAYVNSSRNASTIYEYAHGGTSPIATLGDPGKAWGCAVDPTTGNLAAANLGSVAIYAGARGNPTLYYTTSDMSPYGFCGYDEKGNLYLPVSIGSAPRLGLARLAHGSGSIDAINLNHAIYAHIGFLPSVQWDGKDVTISSVPSDEGHASGLVSVFRLEITGSDAKVIGTAKLETRNNNHAGQSWIQGKRILGVYYYRGTGHVGVWRYPKGGKPARKIGDVPAKDIGTFYGVTVSIPSSH